MNFYEHMRIRPVRAWINLPSADHPLHKLHGKLVITNPHKMRDNDFIEIYFTEGDVISQIISVNCLCEGWPKHLRKDKR